MKPILLLTLPLFLMAQAPFASAQASLTLTASPAVVPVGGAVTLTLSLVSGGGPAGIQWDMSGLPAGTVIASVAAGKTGACNSTRCLLVGVNATAIPDGPVATLKYTQPAVPSATTILATLAASPAGAAVAVTPPAALTVPVQSNCDVNADGKVDATDVGLVLQAALASTTGSPTILDVVRELIASNGGACLR